MAKAHHRRRSSFSVHESPRAWVSYSPTSEQLRRGLSIVRRSDAQDAIVRYAPSLAQELARRRTYPTAKPVLKRSPRGVYAPTMRTLAVDASQRFLDRVFFCAKRKIRREVLHALDLTRRAGSGGGRKHFKAESFIKCVG